MAARAAFAETRGFVATILTPIIPLLWAIDRNSMFDDRDVIFAVDGERIRNILDLATEYKVLHAAIAYISRSQGEDDEFKSV